MKISKLLVLAAVAMMATGCSDKKGGDDDPINGGNSTAHGTPEECKEYLASSTTEFLNLFDPNDQRAFIEFAAYFSETYGDYELPAEFDIEEEEDIYKPNDYIRSLAKGVKGNLDALTRAVYTYTYNINFDQFVGKYEPRRSSREWVLTDNSKDIKDIIFAFTDADNNPCELRISKAGGTSDFTIDFEDEYYTGDMDMYYYNFSIPHTLKAELKQNGKTLATSKVTSSIDIKGHKMNASGEIEVSNLKANMSFDGNDKKIELKSEFKINNSTKASTSATITGNGLCDIDNIRALIDSNWDEQILEKTLSNGTCNADMLGKIQVVAQVKFDSELFECLNSYWDSYEYSSVSAAELDCKKACRKLNQLVSAQLRFDGKSKNQATMEFEPYLDEYYSTWEYYCNPVLCFGDDSKLSFEEFFTGFTTVENKWEVLINAYEKMWDNAIPRYKR